MLVVSGNKMQTYDRLDYNEIYSNQCLIIFCDLCYFISIIKDFEIIKTYICFDKIKISLSKLKFNLYTNNEKLFDIYLNNYKIIDFDSIEKYRQWLIQFSSKVKVFDFTKFKDFTTLVLESKSQLINIEIVYQWFNFNKNKFKLFNKKQFIIYNFFHIVLYGLSKVYDNKNIPVQYLKMDLSDNRCKTMPKSFNYLTLSLNKNTEIKFSASKQKYLYKIDYSSSFLQLFCLLLDIKIEENIYQFLGKQLQLQENIERQKIKLQVFKIVFSQKIKKFIHIQFFNKMYLFSIFLWENYNNNKYLETFISGKKIFYEQKLSRSKLLNYFITALQSQLYLGLLFQMMQLDNNKVLPRIFIHDAMIFEIDIEYYLENIQIFQKKVLTMNNKLHIKRYLGKNLHNMVKI